MLYLNQALKKPLAPCQTGAELTSTVIGRISLSGGEKVRGKRVAGQLKNIDVRMSTGRCFSLLSRQPIALVLSTPHASMRGASLQNSIQMPEDTRCSFVEKRVDINISVNPLVSSWHTLRLSTSTSSPPPLRESSAQAPQHASPSISNEGLFSRHQCDPR